jgi:uncharacterized membrane protein YbhN (UPF0104 family)
MARWLLRAAVSAVVVVILLTIIPLDAVGDALKRISFVAWFGAVVVFFAGHYCNALKLRLLLGTTVDGGTGAGTGSTLTSACVRAQYAGLVANLSLPGLAGGDLVRAAYLAPMVGLKRVAIASVADRVIDTSTVLLLVVVALPAAGMPPAIGGLIRQAGFWLGVIAAVAVLAGLVVLRLRMFSGLARQLREAWMALSSRRGSVAAAIAISLLVQAAFVMTNVWLARQVGVTTGLAAWFVAWPLSKLIAILPISLGGIGVREAALVSLLAPYGAPREAVLASGILWQAVLIVTGLIGLFATQALLRTTRGPVGPAGRVGPAGPAGRGGPAR